MKVYSDYDPPPAVVLDCSNLPSMTRQSEKDSCDVNLIMKRYEKTGVMPEFAGPAFYADVSAIGDYRDVRERMLMLGDVFAQLPAEVRARFENDEANFAEFIADPANSGEMEQLGLFGTAPAPSAPAPEAAPTVPPVPATPA